MPKCKLEFTIDTGDIDVETALAVAGREDVQGMLVNLIEGTLTAIAQNELVKMKEPEERSLASEATCRINFLTLNLIKAAALTNDYGRLPLPPLVDAVVEGVLALIQQGADAIAAGNYVHALALAESSEEKINRIPELSADYGNY